MPALQRCVGDIDAFFEARWAQRPAVHRSGGPSAFDDLASLDDLDRMVASLGLHASNLRMVKDGATLSPSAYTATVKGRGSGSQPISAPLVYQRYQEGATIVLESLHRYWEPLTDFCRELELSLGHRLQVNAYITPSGSRGFDVHRDDHDVFVLQVSGSKHWIVYDAQDPDGVLIDEELVAGCALYIPKGFPHAANTTEAASAHLTVGILTHDGIDILRETMRLAEDHAAFRERLDLRGRLDTVSIRSIVEEQLDELRTWLDKVDLDEVTERVARRIFTTAQPVTRGLLRQLDGLDEVAPHTAVRRRNGAVCVLFPKATTLKVLLADRELEMPLVAREAMEEVARRDRFSAQDLTPFLELGSALVLVRRLIREGLLEVAVGR